mgnify:CR=1 FL=1
MYTMSILTKQIIFKTSLVLLLLCSCTEEKKAEPAFEKPKPTAADTTLNEKTPSVEEVQIVPQEKLSGLANLTKLKNRADMRGHDQSVWQTAVVGTSFFKHDALQTHENANAQVNYQSGSVLKLKENTLVIFDKDPGQAELANDRVLLKNGELSGSTKKELWIFTNAGLVQIKSLKKNQKAQATLSINPQKKLKLVVNQGTADIIVKKNNTEFQKFSVAEKADFEFKAKVGFNLTDEKTISSDNIGVLSQASTRIKNATQAELIIEAPIDNATSSDEIFEVKGHLTELGAKLIINGEITDIEDDLSFKKKLNLSNGINLVVFQLVRSDSSVKFYRRNVRLSKTK